MLNTTHDFLSFWILALMVLILAIHSICHHVIYNVDFCLFLLINKTTKQQLTHTSADWSISRWCWCSSISAITVDCAFYAVINGDVARNSGPSVTLTIRASLIQSLDLDRSLKLKRELGSYFL